MGMTEMGIKVYIKIYYSSEAERSKILEEWFSREDNLCSKYIYHVFFYFAYGGRSNGKGQELF